MSRTLQLAEQLISRPSITPKDAGCLELLSQRLETLGFTCERMDSGPETFRVQNLWATRRSGLPHAKTLIFAGHTDVVPTGPEAQWSHPPFTPTYHAGKLYGRGASDMKTSIAAFVVAVEEFLQTHTSTTPLDLAFLLTSDEEGPGIDGTKIVCQQLQARSEAMHWCIVGEPTAVNRTGDMIKNGRRGSLSGRLTIEGIQGHIAYPQLARNPIHQALPALAELASVEWDHGNEFFPPTSWQISNMHSGAGATNIIPGEAVVDFNFRYSSESTAESLKQRVKSILDKHALEYDLTWSLSGEPFLTPLGDLVSAAQQAIHEVTSLETQLSTSGGTSDGRFIAKVCPQVIELGPPNATIHKIDEHIVVADVEPLKNIYRRILELLHEHLLSEKVTPNATQ